MAGFNPHTHAGCDFSDDSYRTESSYCFNPHTHAGCDEKFKTNNDSFKVSIHTPTQGVTPFPISNPFGGSVSIHTPTQGVTLYLRILTLRKKFQSTHPRRVWLLLSFGQLKSFSVSIHTPTQGVTMSFWTFFFVSMVSIHTPTQGVTGERETHKRG